jgi:5-formyltetrahydrofolate cyclo-ligase
MDLAEKKKELRRECVAKRQALTLDEWSQKSEEVIKNVIGSKEFEEAQIIHCFVSMNDRMEVNTHPFIQKAIEKGKTVVVPVTNFSTDTLSHSKVISLASLHENKWGVLEPSEIEPISTGELDLILVPLLAADQKGNRLGYGKGFYDQFLSNTDAKAFGLIFEDFILKEIPTESFDQKLNGLFSEKGLIYT